MIRKFCLTLAVISAASFSIVSAQQTAKVTASGIGYLEYLPQGYNSNSDKYPIVISLHGVKEKGTSTNDRSRIIADLEKVDNVGLPKYVKHGKKYPFILISPQLKNKLGSWPSSYVIDVLNHVKKYLRIDERRIYLTGLSLGGLGVWRTAGDYPEVFAAIGPICPGGNAISKAKELAAENVAAWGFHGSNDRIVSYKVTTNMINAMNSAPKKPNPLAKATIYAGAGHIIWDKAYNETNLLDWMLSHRNGSTGGSDDGDDDNDNGNGGDGDNDNDNDEGDDDDNDSEPNKQPVVRAGSDKTLTLPRNALYIEGSANDPDGKVTSYHWTKISGGSASLNGANNPKIRIYNLKEGTYVFRLTARDNDGAEHSDDMTVVVRKGANQEEEEEEPKPNPKNSLPRASAGPDRFVTLPTNSVTIKATASDKDGKIVSYEWTQTYGHRKVSLSGANSSTLRAFDLKEGEYIFRLRVKDNDGGTKDDYFKITVKRASNSDNGDNKKNVLPYASAGPDRVLKLPTNSVYIQANASDKDGKIVSYQWVQTYGKKASMSGDRTSRVRIYNISKGPHIFKLVVKDNDGGVREDYFKITVTGNEVAHNSGNNNGSTDSDDNSSANARPVADAGPDLRVRGGSPITLHGSGVDRDGQIVTYQWKQLAGPRITIRNSKSPDVTISDLKKGRYYFSLTVKDDDNATHVDEMAIRVTGS